MGKQKDKMNELKLCRGTEVTKRIVRGEKLQSVIHSVMPLTNVFKHTKEYCIYIYISLLASILSRVVVLLLTSLSPLFRCICLLFSGDLRKSNKDESLSWEEISR